MRRVTDSRNQEDTGRHARTGRSCESSTGGHWRTRPDTEGHVTATVRDREAVRLVRRSGRGATPDGESRHPTGCD